MKNVFREIVSGGFAGIVFTVFYLLVIPNVLICLVMGALAFVGTQLLFGKRQKEMIFIADGITKDDAKRIIDEGKQKVNRIKSFIPQINQNHIVALITSICHTADQIFADFHQDPKDIKIARKFLNYYLDTTELIIGKYVTLKNRGVESEKITETLLKTEEILSAIDETFKKQMQKLLEDDVMDLDIEISILEKTIKSEGL